MIDHDPHVIEKKRHEGDRDGEVTFYAVGPMRHTLEEAEHDLRLLIAALAAYHRDERAGRPQST